MPRIRPCAIGRRDDSGRLRRELRQRTFQFSPKTADIVILGAGVMGASIAFQLAKRKAGKIVVIDKEHVGAGGSGRSSALVRMHYSFPPEVQLALLSLQIFQNWQRHCRRAGGLSQNWIRPHRASERNGAA